jgi:hypothetical protein
MKNNEKVCYFILAAIFISVLPGCATIREKNCPYVITGEIKPASEQTAFTNEGCDFTFCNLAEKEIIRFTIVLYVYDADGNPPFTGTDCITSHYSGPVAAGDEMHGEISFDDYITEPPDELCQIDFLYVSHIYYSDGTVWDDPFGSSVL